MKSMTKVLGDFAAGLVLAGACTIAFAAHPDAIEKSKQEKGLVVYGNVNPVNFAPVAVRNLFNKDYFTNSAEGFNVNTNYLKAQGRTLSVRFGVDY